MNDLSKSLASDLDRALSEATLMELDSADYNVEKMGDMHRRIAAKYEQRIANTRKGCRATVASLEGQMKAEEERHAASMAILVERILETKERAEQEIAADRKIVAASKAAIDALTE